MHGSKNIYIIYIFVLNWIFPKESSALQGGKAQPNSTTSWTFPSEPISSWLLSPDLFLWNMYTSPRVSHCSVVPLKCITWRKRNFSFFFFLLVFQASDASSEKLFNAVTNKGKTAIRITNVFFPPRCVSSRGNFNGDEMWLVWQRCCNQLVSAFYVSLGFRRVLYAW